VKSCLWFGCTSLLMRAELFFSAILVLLVAGFSAFLVLG
jgi:hypothetical protein